MVNLNNVTTVLEMSMKDAPDWGMDETAKKQEAKKKNCRNT